MKRIIAIAMMVAGMSAASHAQTLLYQWNFTNNITGTLTNMPPAYTAPALAGTGDLFITNTINNTLDFTLPAAGTTCYFTNGPGVGPGFGPGGSGAGAYNIDTQSYNNAGTNAAACTVVGTNLNLGTMYKVTVSFWFKFGPSLVNQFPRIVMVAASRVYDNGGANGLGSSVNGWTGPVAQTLQNAVGGSVANDASGVQTANLPPAFTNNIGVNGNGVFSNQWFFQAIEYDATLPSNNYKVWLGTTTTNIVLVQQRTVNYGGIAFGSNATLQLGNRNLNGTRGMSSGQIADVRIYAGICSSNNLEVIRTFATGFVDDGSGTASAPVVALEPVSGASHVGQSRTFSVSATGLTPLAYQWKSNNVAIAGATNAALVLTNIPLSANGASYYCTVTNAVGATNSTAATLTVVAAPPGSYAAAMLAQNPYIYWHLNETTNGAANPAAPVSVSDYINGLDGVAPYPANTSFNETNLSSPPYPGFATTNTAIQIFNNAQGSLLNMATLSTFTNGMTICGWIKTFGVPPAHGIIYSQNPANQDGGGTTGSGYGLKFGGVGTDVNGNPGGLLSYNWNYTIIGSSAYSPTLVVPTNVWTFIALTIDPTGQFATLFMGSPETGIMSSVDDTNATGSLIVGTTSATGRMVLGRSPYGFWEGVGSYFGGENIAFNDVALLNQALSLTTLTNLYVTGAGIPLPKLTGVPDGSGNLILTWNFGTLQEATAVTGPYTDVVGSPVSPSYVPLDPTDPQRFYRVRN